MARRAAGSRNLLHRPAEDFAAHVRARNVRDDGVVLVVLEMNHGGLVRFLPGHEKETVPDRLDLDGHGFRSAMAAIGLNAGVGKRGLGFEIEFNAKFDEVHEIAMADGWKRFRHDSLHNYCYYRISKFIIDRTP